MKVNLHDFWSEYELLDCGNSAKLERFGELVLIRPEVSANFDAILPYEEWRQMAHAEFVETSKNAGVWNLYKPVPEKWNIDFISQKMKIRAELSLTNSKHIGVFPEQVLNWKFIEKISPDFPNMEFLNLFGYTGLSSIAVAPMAQRVTHIDSIKKVVEWTKKNAQLSGYENIRCIADDAPKFVSREVKRGNMYDGIIMDPPAIGVGSNNEKWVLEEMIDNLLIDVSKILKDRSFVIMNLYSHSMNEKFIHRLLLTYFPQHRFEFCEKVYGQSRSGNFIDHGFFVRLVKLKDYSEISELEQNQ
jgi:23S rRNA (cytosine1962-C5)-methyltransferase